MADSQEHTQTHTRTHARTKSISIDHSLQPQSPHPHTLHFFALLVAVIQEEKVKKKEKKRMKTPCSTRVATQDEFCSTSAALSGRGSVFTTLLQVQY